MRRVVDRERVVRFMRRLGREAHSEVRVYLTGGATALLHEWRETTVDVDIRIEPEAGDVLRAVPALKEELEINVELASPGDFIPEVPGWRDRSVFIAREGRISFYHYDFYAQALSKIERGHQRDLDDVEAMFRRRLINADALRRYFAEIEPELFRYPAIDPPTFRRSVEAVVRRQEPS